MINLACPNCGSNLVVNSETRKACCEYCDSLFSLQDGEISLAEIRKDDVYEKASQMMAEGNIYFLEEAAKLFQTIIDWKDSEAKRKQCLDLIYEQKKQIEATATVIAAKRERTKKIRLIAFILIVVVISSFYVFRAMAHNEKRCSVVIKSLSTSEDQYSNYVFLDYRITNDTSATIDYLKITTRFKDSEGKTLGTISSEFGSLYGNGALNLDAHTETIEETFLSEGTRSMTSLFEHLYQKGINDLSVSYEILNIKWTDGFTYKR